MNKKKYYRSYLNTAADLGPENLKSILKSSKIGIDSELLFSIVVIEKLNRGSFSNRVLEKTLSLIFPSIIIKRNASIGLCQIRVGTARKVIDGSERDIVKSLMLPNFNIDVMAKLIKIYSEENPQDKDIRRTILNLHTTGNKFASPNIYLNIYYEIVNWSIKRKLFSKTYSNSFLKHTNNHPSARKKS